MRHLALLALGLMIWLQPAAAQETPLSIMTGSPTGTYIQFGRDMQKLMSDCGHSMEVVESAGSLENFLGVRQRPNTQFGIVQNDVLEYMNTFASEDPAIARTIQGVRIAFPLYDEEIHVLARNDIADFNGLQGKRVAIGVENSGTFLTASLMLSLANVTPAERLLVAPADALTQLKDGQIDAFFYVAGAPATLFSEGDVNDGQFHLLPIKDETLRSVYTPTTIPAGTYGFQKEAVDLVAVKAVLMTYEYEARRNAYHSAACNAVSDLSSLILGRLEDLKANGHPKWKDVDLGALPPGWDIAACVNRGISADYQPRCTAPTPVATPESEANAAYRRNICAVMGC
jgi:TRAP transporter TAXI family solute receptor